MILHTSNPHEDDDPEPTLQPPQAYLITRVDVLYNDPLKALSVHLTCGGLRTAASAPEGVPPVAVTPSVAIDLWRMWRSAPAFRVGSRAHVFKLSGLLLVPKGITSVRRANSKWFLFAAISTTIFGIDLIFIALVQHIA